MESALDVLSHAATMVQDSANEARLTSKELPTAKWRRERRLRAGEYHHTPSVGAAAAAAVASATSTNSPPGSPPTHLPHTTATALAAHSHAVTSSVPALGYAHGAAMTGPAPPGAHALHAMMRPLNESSNPHGTPPPLHAPLHQHQHHFHHHHHQQQQHHHHNQQQDHQQQQQQQQQQAMESPIDMSVSSSSMKLRASPPPPYREPLPGSTYASSLARPSVITQAPPKREPRENMLLSNAENDNRSSDSHLACENVIDEHFRRSLGPNYVALFGKKSPAPLSPQTPSLPTTSVGPHTPPLPPSVAPPYPQSLISPKPTASLLSPAAIAAAHIKAERLSPHQLEKTSPPMPTPTSTPTPLAMTGAQLPPPQQQPLALSQRVNSPITSTPPPPPQPPTPSLTPTTPVPMSSGGDTNSAAIPLVKATATTTTLGSPSPQSLHQQQQQQRSPTPGSVELHSTTQSPTPSPPGHSIGNTANVSSSSSASASTPPLSAVMPAIMRIKTEPGLTAATAANNTPPASPTSSSNASISTNSTDILASVDDHFAKALGDTWKKLQEAKELRK